MFRPFTTTTHLTRCKVLIVVGSVTFMSKMIFGIVGTRISVVRRRTRSTDSRKRFESFLLVFSFFSILALLFSLYIFQNDRIIIEAIELSLSLSLIFVSPKKKRSLLSLTKRDRNCKKKIRRLNVIVYASLVSYTICLIVYNTKSRIFHRVLDTNIFT